MSDATMQNETVFRSGFASIVGAPNVGKSTLLNALLGQKLSIVSPKPQTTRDRILGVLTTDQGQIVWLDTPGIHVSKQRLNRYMVEQALATLSDADVVILVVDAFATEKRKSDGAADREIASRAGDMGKPLVVCLNKIDRLRDKAALLPQIAAWQDHAPRAIVPTSALSTDGVTDLLAEIWPLLPEGPAYFDGDALTDRSRRWLAAELIRERVFFQLRQEIPYSTAVQVERFEERELVPKRKGDPTMDYVIEAVIYVERDSQKGILVGRQGARIKALGTEAREELRRFFGCPVHLMLRVKVEPDWARSAQGLRRVGYE